MTNDSDLKKANLMIYLSQALIALSYYGVISLQASFLTKGLLISETQTIKFISTYLTVVNISIFFGAIFSEKLIGIRRTFILGHAFYCLAFTSLFLLSIFPEYAHIEIITISFVFMSMSGTLMNSSSNALLTRAHQTVNRVDELDISYSFQHLTNKIGSVIGKTAYPLFIGTSLGIMFGYRLGFFISICLTLFNVLNLSIRGRILDIAATDIDKKNISLKTFILVVTYLTLMFSLHLGIFHISSMILSYISVILFCYGIFYFIKILLQSPKNQRAGIFLALIICIQMIVFFIYRNQMFTSLALYPIHAMKPLIIGGLEIRGEFAASFNSFWGILGTPIIIIFLQFFNKNNKTISIGFKFILGMFLTMISYGIFYYSTIYAQSLGGAQISILWFIAGHAFVAMAEILIMNLALSTLSTLVPQHLIATIIGFHYMSMGIGAIIAGKLASIIAIDSTIVVSSIDIFSKYQEFFSILTFLAFCATILFVLTTPLMNKLYKKIERE